MKKKHFFAVAFIAAAAILGMSRASQEEVLSDTLLANIEALADDDEINPLCPNGCIADGDGCFCYAWYKDLAEYPWEK